MILVCILSSQRVLCVTACIIINICVVSINCAILVCSGLHRCIDCFKSWLRSNVSMCAVMYVNLLEWENRFVVDWGHLSHLQCNPSSKTTV